MLSRSFWATFLLLGSCVGLWAVLTAGGKAQPAVSNGGEQRVAAILPGLQPDGLVQLPNQWKLSPVGTPMQVGDFPVNIGVHPSGKYLAILHAGLRNHEIIGLELRDQQRPRIISRVGLPQSFHGMCFSPDGKQVYASGAEYERVHVFDFKEGFLSNPRIIDLTSDLKDVIIGGVAVSPDGQELFAAATWGDAIFRTKTVGEAEPTIIPLPAPEVTEGEPKPREGVESAPLALLVTPDGERLFASLWSRAAIAVIDLANNQIIDLWPTAPHPTEMQLTPDGSTLYVSCANSTKVSVIDVTNGKGLQTIACSLYPTAPTGNTPNSLTITDDGNMLFVANADANNLAVFNIADRNRAQPLGFIPTGWYPTSVRYNPGDKQIYVANGKGLVSKANPSGPTPEVAMSRNLFEYIGQLYRGALTYFPMPTPQEMTEYSKLAYRCSPLERNNAVHGTEGVADDNPIPKKIGDPSPIKYCIYIVKENRTYDQVFGDMPQGNGEPQICLFPEKVTPNHHRLAREFVLLDNFYVEGEVSADGHEWSMGAYATDFVERSWPLTYGGTGKGKIGYPSEGAYNQIARPTGGYIWDKCKEAGVSYRSYGEWVINGETPDDPAKPAVPALEGHIDPGFRSYDLDYLDVDRAKRFISELERFEKAGDMPQMQIVRLPNDHTYGTRPGKQTPTAMVADNDLALGMVVDAVSKSKFWKETAIFVVEDDAQNGPDHVDAHRAVALVISPYTKRRVVDSTMYSTSSMLRTMELILGLQPMSQFDAAARPMFNSFQAQANLKPYDHVVPRVNMKALNPEESFGAAWSKSANLAKEDAADDLLFNEVIWKAVKGADSPCPPPVRAAFFMPEDEDEEDEGEDEDDENDEDE